MKIPPIAFIVIFLILAAGAYFVFFGEQGSNVIPQQNASNFSNESAEIFALESELMEVVQKEKEAFNRSISESAN